jgi:uncharacterized protein
MKIRPLLENLSPPLKLLAFVVIILASLLFVSLAGLVIGTMIFGQAVAQSLPRMEDLSDPTMIAQLKFFQIISQFGLFIIPVLIFLLLAGNKRAGYLQAGMPGRKVFWIIAACVLIIALPLVNWLVEVNMLVKFPPSLQGMEAWMKAQEESAAHLTEAFLSSNSIPGFLVNFFMIALIPAIGEEFVFRGVLLRLFREWTKNIHVSVIITALLFSFIHFQFYGFLPRFLMGVLLGYLMYWSGSIWVPVLAHFVNNATAVVVAFLSASGYISVDFSTFGSSNSAWIILISGLSTTLLIFYMWKKRTPVREEPAIPDQEQHPLP